MEFNAQVRELCERLEHLAGITEFMGSIPTWTSIYSINCLAVVTAYRNKQKLE